MTIDKLIEKFCLHLEESGRSKSTIIAYKKDLEQLDSFLPGKSINNITTQGLNSFVTYLTNDLGFSKKTASRKVNSLKTFFKYLFQEGLIKSNPAIDVKHPKFKNKPQNMLSILEYKALRDTAKRNLRVSTMIELLLQTGARIGEISRLKLEHIKLNALPPKMIITEFASNPMRVVELNSVATETLKNYITNRKKQIHDKGYLFNTRTGNNVLVRNIRTAIDRIFLKSGIKGAKVNDIRNTFIVFQIENGVSLKKLAEIVGHKRLSSTERYLKLSKRKIPGKGTKIKPL